MNNPCNKCLVSAACKIECDKFVKYLKHIVDRRQSKDDSFIFNTARRLRDGTAKLTDTEILYFDSPDNKGNSHWWDEGRTWAYGLPKKGKNDQTM